jgi:prepilin-type N-terminal cleavage/methylation domain-containing protein
MKLSRKAFTLIELLIVVAIIAILAAIAVPNFLEAQMRSKVARVKTDMRTMATAIETYAVDYNNPPPGQDDWWAQYPDFPTANGKALSLLTTPVAYLTSLPTDPFFSMVGVDFRGRQSYTYMRFDESDVGEYRAAFGLGYRWGLQTKGPSMQPAYMSYGMDDIVARPEGILCIYDATNGTKSSGVIIRTNKGELTGAEK